MTTPPWSYRTVLREQYVSRLLGSALLSRLGEQMFSLALVLQVLDVFASPRLAGIAVFVSFAPGMVISPIAGALLDRVGAVRAIIADLVASAVLVAAMAFVPGDATVLLVLAALFSLTNPLGIAGVRTLMPRLVPGPAMERANALDIGSYNLVEVTGPVLAGGLFALAGGQVTLLTIAVFYAAAFLLLLRIPPGAGGQREVRADEKRDGLLTAAMAGVRYVLTHPVLRALVISYGFYQIAWGILVVTVPVVATGNAEQVRSGGSTAGLLWGIVGLAGIAGALIVGRICTAGRERPAIVLGSLVTGLAAAPVIAFGGVVGLIAGLVAVGLASGPVNVGLLTLRQRRTDPGWLGRVLTVSISLNLIGMPIGSAVGGYLAAIAPALAFTVAGAAALLSALTARILVPGEVSPPVP